MTTYSSTLVSEGSRGSAARPPPSLQLAPLERRRFVTAIRSSQIKRPRLRGERRLPAPLGREPDHSPSAREPTPFTTRRGQRDTNALDAGITPHRSVVRNNAKNGAPGKKAVRPSSAPCDDVLARGQETRSRHEGERSAGRCGSGSRISRIVCGTIPTKAISPLNATAAASPACDDAGAGRAGRHPRPAPRRHHPRTSSSRRCRQQNRAHDEYADDRTSVQPRSEMPRPR